MRVAWISFCEAANECGEQEVAKIKLWHVLHVLQAYALNIIQCKLLLENVYDIYSQKQTKKTNSNLMISAKKWLCRGN